MTLRQDVLSVDEGRHNGGSAELVPNSGFVSVVQTDGSNVGPQIFTLTWSIRELPLRQSTDGAFRLLGQLRWGVGVAAHRVEFDLGRCGNISLVGSNLSFEAKNEGEGTFNVVASLAYGTRGAGAASTVTYTQPFETVNHEWTGSLPSFARKYSVQPKNEGLFAGGALSVQELQPNLLLLRTWFPTESTAIRTLGNDVTHVKVYTSPDEPEKGIILYELAL